MSAFEKWWTTARRSRYDDKSFRTDVAQDAFNAGLEAAAKACVELEMCESNPADDLSYEIATQDCADAIRAMIKK